MDPTGNSLTPSGSARGTSTEVLEMLPRKVRAGTKTAERYSKYQAAKTVGEALRFGALAYKSSVIP